jgi:beta-N-acetylhexosaminidase
MNFGSFLVSGFDGLSPSADFLRFVRQVKPGGIIFFARNYESPKQLRELAADLKSASSEPLLLMADQEGGPVMRFKEGFPEVPPMRAFGEKRDFEGLARAYRKTAEALHQAGVDMNLAPVVDVVTSPENEYLRPRSFGEEPFIVSQMAACAVEALRSGGVFACAKHFVALGDSARDPHQLLPVSQASKEKLEVAFFPPFRAALAAGVDAVMTTHIRVPAIDAQEPVVFSQTALSILRSVLGFEGVVLTDDLEMKAIADHWGVPQAALQALSAGNDMALVCHTLDWQQKALELIAHEAEKDREFARRLEQSRKRIRALWSKKRV